MLYDWVWASNEIVGTPKPTTDIIGSGVLCFWDTPSITFGQICLGNGYASKPRLFYHEAFSVSECWPVSAHNLSNNFSFHFISLFSILGNKFFCGWACPIGAIQEIFNQIPLPKKLKTMLPFRITNPIRTIIFVAFITLVFTVSISIYDYFNPFSFLHWGFEAMAIVALLVTLAASVFFFRPFCYLICPIGLFTWVLEQFSLLKVKVNKLNCNDCNLCIRKSSCPAVKSILDERRFRPDCFACGRCIEVCPEKALGFAR